MSMFIVAMQVGMWLGYVTFGFISDAFGRRPTYITYLLIAAVLVWYYGFAREPWVLLVLGPFVAFFGTGYFSGFGAVASEIFPTSIRATALGVTYNSGRLLSAVAPFIVGTMAQNRGFGAAFTLTSIALHDRGGVVAGDSGDEGTEDDLGRWPLVKDPSRALVPRGELVVRRIFGDRFADLIQFRVELVDRRRG